VIDLTKLYPNIKQINGYNDFQSRASDYSSSQRKQDKEPGRQSIGNTSTLVYPEFNAANHGSMQQFGSSDEQSSVPMLKDLQVDVVKINP